jgi:nucleoside 2-deoxyribosyltransferase
MTLEALKKYDLIYTGTPYSKYPGGIEAAFVDACRLTGRLLTAGLKVYSPIAHTHPIAVHGNIDPYDHAIWLPFDAAIMDKADAMIVAMMTGWDTSFGVRYEIDTFVAAGKPVYFMSPVDLSYAPSAPVIAA